MLTHTSDTKHIGMSSDATSLRRSDSRCDNQ